MRAEVIYELREMWTKVTSPQTTQLNLRKQSSSCSYASIHSL